MKRAIINSSLIGMSILQLTACASPRPCGEPIAPRDNAPRQVTVLGDDLSPLRQAFNEGADQWRVMALVSPTCSECVLGAEAVEKEITARYPAHQVDALIIWIPMLKTDSEQAARESATIFPPQRATQFYDAQQTVGTLYARQTFAGFYERARRVLPDDHRLAAALDDRIEVKRPQWDLYMLYAPGVQWEQASAAPPMPTHWIRHLGRTQDRKRSVYWQDVPENGPKRGDLFKAIRVMADQAIGQPQAMRIEVLGFEDCPNTPQTRANVQKALKSIGLATDVVYIDQNSLSPNDHRRGWPSPTVLVDGRDLFGMAQPQGTAMGCRTYQDGAPSEAEIAKAMQSHIH